MIEYFLPRASEFAKDIDRLFDVITYLVGFWFLIALGVFFYLLFRFRRRPGQRAQYITGETHKQKLAIEIPHYGILACDLLILVMTFFVWHKVKIDIPTADDEVRIVGQQWAWKFHHTGEDGLWNTEDDIVTVNELHLKKGAQYTYLLESIDVMHSFSVPVFRLKQDAIPGRIIRGHFKPILSGQWDIQCAEMCGYMHGGMVAKVVIHEEADYAEWLAANTPEDAKSNASVAAANTSVTKEDKNNG